MIVATHGFLASSGAGLPFEFTVKTDNAGVSTSTQFRMPLTTSTGLNFVVDWGDGVTETITNHTLAIHTYATAGTYTIKVLGSILGWRFNNTGDRLKMLNVVTWGALNISTDQGFNGCTNLTCSATDAPIITSSSLERYFQSCTNFNGAIGNWNMSSVTNVSTMFLACTNFNQPIANWNVSNVTNMSEMFSGATAFNQDIGSWNVSNVTNFANFMAGKNPNNYSPTNLDSIYNGWSALLSVKPNISINFGTIIYNQSAQAGKDILNNAPNNWTIVDGGVLRTETFEFSVKTDNAGTSTSTQFRMPLTSSVRLYFNVNWGDGSPVELITNHTLAIHTYATAGTYTISTVGNIESWSFNNGGDRLKMLNVSQWAGLIISVDRGFMGCTNLTATATDAPLITSMSLSRYFQSCTNFNGAIGNWNMSSVTNVSTMFFACTNFNQPIGTWNTSNITNMGDLGGGMFANCTNFNQNLAAWDINQVSDFRDLMSAVTLSTANYDAILISWEAQAPISGRSISFGFSKYTLASPAETARARLISIYNWTITDGGGI